MSVEENLTYLQKVAIKGEVALTVSTAAHDAEIKFRTYLILKEIEGKYIPFIIECLKEAVTFDEDIIDRIYLDVLYNTVPVWLWIDEIISDIKIHLVTAENNYNIPSVMKLSINKLAERKNIIESAFIKFAREAILVSPSAVEELLDKILDDYDLEFLHNACFYLKSGCIEVKEAKGEEKEVPEEIMSCLFDPKKALNFSTETKALSMLDKLHKKYSNVHTIQNNIVVPIPEEIPLDKTSEYVSKKINELFGELISTPTEPSNTVYIVKKVFTDSGLTTDIRTCKTEEEAINFVKKIIKEYPELLNTCEFQVCSERVNGKEKNKWKQKET